MENRKITAVQQTLNWIKKYREFNGGDYPNGDEIEAQLTMQLELEKEQKKEDFIAGMQFIAVDPNKYNEDAEQYYQNTYGNKESNGFTSLI